MLKLLKSIFALILHIWFYTITGVITLILSPALLVSLLRKKDFILFFWIARNIWANSILYLMGMIPKISNKGFLTENKSYMLVANHTSMLDIMLMYRASKNPFIFMGKKELANFPVFGFFYKRVSILVNRENLKSRQVAYQETNRYIKKGFSVCIFPEGGIPKDKSITLGKFQSGAFRLSLENKLTIVPITFFDNKKRFPYEKFKGSIGYIRAKIHEPLDTHFFTEKDSKSIKNAVYNIILKDLESDQNITPPYKHMVL